MFLPTSSFVQARLEDMALSSGYSIEVYSSGELAAQEKKALERRLSRETGDSSLLVILSQKKARPSEQ